MAVGRGPVSEQATCALAERNFCVTLLYMAKRPTGAERYFTEQMRDPEYLTAYEDSRRRIDQVDRLMRSLDARREDLGLSKAELARRADLAPELVRRLFSVDSPNPTASTLASLALAMDLDLVAAPCKEAQRPTRAPSGAARTRVGVAARADSPAVRQRSGAASTGRR